MFLPTKGWWLQGQWFSWLDSAMGVNSGFSRTNATLFKCSGRSPQNEHFFSLMAIMTHFWLFSIFSKTGQSYSTDKASCMHFLPVYFIQSWAKPPQVLQVVTDISEENCLALLETLQTSRYSAGSGFHLVYLFIYVTKNFLPIAFFCAWIPKLILESLFIAREVFFLICWGNMLYLK